MYTIVFFSLTQTADLKSLHRSHPPLQHQPVQGEFHYELHNCPIPLYTFASKISRYGPAICFREIFDFI